LCPPKSDTRGRLGEDSSASCLCSDNPDIPDAGNYDSSLFQLKHFSEDQQELLAEEKLVTANNVVLISCWSDGELLDNADADEAVQQSCIVCASCWNCSDGTGSIPVPMPGFWRQSPISSKSHKCFYQYGCLGGSDSQCNASYTGALCASCEQGYTSTAKSCEECPHGFLSFLLASGTGAAFFGMVLYIISQNYSAMKPFVAAEVLAPGPAESEAITIAARTLFAFLQVQSLSGDFRLNWPGLIVAVNAIQGMVAEPSMLLMFLQCVQPPSPSGEDIGSTPWAFVRAVYMLILLPLGCWLGPLFYFAGLHMFSIVKATGGNCRNAVKSIKSDGKGGLKEAASQYMDKYTSAVCILFFIMHPSLVRETLYLLACIQLEEGFSVLRAYRGVVCDATHANWVVFVAVPSLVLWAVGLPVYAFYRLWRLSKTASKDFGEDDEQANRLDDADIQRKYGFLYRGYERKFFYWELVVTARKVGMILIAVMLEGYGPGVQALVALLMIQVAIVMHVRKEPFDYGPQDRLETTSLGCSFLCLVGGLFFWSQNVQDMTGSTSQTDLVSVVLTFTIIGLNMSVFVYVLQRVLISQFRAAIAWMKKQWKERKAGKLLDIASGNSLGLWHKIKAFVRRYILWNKAKVYSADETKKMKVANNARAKVERAEAAKAAAQIEELGTKLKAAHRSLLRIKEVKEEVEKLKDPQRGLPSLASDIDGVQDWLDRLADSIKLETFDKSHRVADEHTVRMINHVDWWARNELKDERPPDPDQEEEPVHVITLEDLEELWSKSYQCQTESEFHNDVQLLASLEQDAKLRWAPQNKGR
jgi:hypothetical protein